MLMNFIVNLEHALVIHVYIHLQKRAKAQALLDKVFEHLELIEKDYFGLQFADIAPSNESMVGINLTCLNCHLYLKLG